jgi:predicted metal-dependent hydrolase
VPGHFPHPASDPAGHLFGAPHPVVEPLRPSDWRLAPHYLYGVDLFNQGYYWESHEAWEALWHAAGRTGPLADFLKGLIKLAAAAVKVREGNPRGVRRHAQRAAELLAATPETTYCGLEKAQLLELAARLGERAETYQSPQPTLLLEAWLRLADIEPANP